MKKIIPLILSTLLLTSCSGPDSSGGVVFSKTDNSFPFGDCRGSGHQAHSTAETGCGWFTAHEKSYYMMPNARFLSGPNLRLAYLPNANLTNANLTNAMLIGADLNSANPTNANLSKAILYDAILTGANLSHANLTGVILTLIPQLPSGIKANSSTICPNGINYGTSGNDCPF